jgi:hypothetical protein
LYNMSGTGVSGESSGVAESPSQTEVTDMAQVRESRSDSVRSERRSMPVVRQMRRSGRKTTAVGTAGSMARARDRCGTDRSRALGRGSGVGGGRRAVSESGVLHELGSAEASSLVPYPGGASGSLVGRSYGYASSSASVGRRAGSESEVVHEFGSTEASSLVSYPGGESGSLVGRSYESASCAGVVKGESVGGVGRELGARQYTLTEVSSRGSTSVRDLMEMGSSRGDFSQEMSEGIGERELAQRVGTVERELLFTQTTPPGAGMVERELLLTQTNPRALANTKTHALGSLRTPRASEESSQNNSRTDSSHVLVRTNSSHKIPRVDISSIESSHDFLRANSSHENNHTDSSHVFLREDSSHSKSSHDFLRTVSSQKAARDTSCHTNSSSMSIPRIDFSLTIPRTNSSHKSHSRTDSAHADSQIHAPGALDVGDADMRDSIVQDEPTLHIHEDKLHPPTPGSYPPHTLIESAHSCGGEAGVLTGGSRWSLSSEDPRTPGSYPAHTLIESARSCGGEAGVLTGGRRFMGDVVEEGGGPRWASHDMSVESERSVAKRARVVVCSDVKRVADPGRKMGAGASPIPCEGERTTMTPRDQLLGGDPCSADALGRGDIRENVSALYPMSPAKGEGVHLSLIPIAPLGSKKDAVASPIPCKGERAPMTARSRPFGEDTCSAVPLGRSDVRENVSTLYPVSPAKGESVRLSLTHLIACPGSKKGAVASPIPCEGERAPMTTRSRLLGEDTCSAGALGRGDVRKNVSALYPVSSAKGEGVHLSLTPLAPMDPVTGAIRKDTSAAMRRAMIEERDKFFKTALQRAGDEGALTRTFVREPSQEANAETEVIGQELHDALDFQMLHHARPCIVETQDELERELRRRHVATLQGGLWGSRVVAEHEDPTKVYLFMGGSTPAHEMRRDEWQRYEAVVKHCIAREAVMREAGTYLQQPNMIESQSYVSVLGMEVDTGRTPGFVQREAESIDSGSRLGNVPWGRLPETHRVLLSDNQYVKASELEFHAQQLGGGSGCSLVHVRLT